LADIGRVNSLLVLRSTPQGLYLQGGWLGEVLLPTRYVPEGCRVGDTIDAFIYLDSEDRYIATTEKPKAQVGEVAFLKVVEVNDFGAFLDWGLPKDLLVPFNQQATTMKEGQSYLVYLYTDDETHRIAASSKLNKFIRHRPEYFTKGHGVELYISDKTDLGYVAVIEHRSWGVLFYSDVVKPLRIGQRIKGYIKRIRDDGKIDLSLHAPGFAVVDDMSRKVLRELAKNDGFLPLSDKSEPELIYDRFGVSKRAYKMTIGTLYKQQLITIEKDGIRLTEQGKDA
jgi:hypothetical protein